MNRSRPDGATLKCEGQCKCGIKAELNDFYWRHLRDQERLERERMQRVEEAEHHYALYREFSTYPDCPHEGEMGCYNSAVGQECPCQKGYTYMKIVATFRTREDARREHPYGADIRVHPGPFAPPPGGYASKASTRPPPDPQRQRDSVIPE
jgi:hypothetical protein